MKRYVMFTFVGITLLSLSIVSASRGAVPFVEVEVRGVSFDAAAQTPVVILVDKEGKKAFPIWIGTQEAVAMEKELTNSPSPRPMTHDLFHSILLKMQARVKEVRVVELK